MEKVITVDGKQIRLKSTGATPLLYKMHFKRDFFKDLFKMYNISENDISALDLEVFYNMVWLLAKGANKDIDSPLEWLDGFDEFPIMEIVPQIQDMIESMLKTTNQKK